MTTRDRRLALLASTTTNGVDFVEVASADQTRLRVHFLNAVSLRGSLARGSPVTIAGGEVIQTVPVNPVDEAVAWSADSDGRPLLSVSVPAPGDFSLYTLTVNTVSPAGSAPVLDPFLDAASFTFKVNCPTTVDADGGAVAAGQAGPPEPAIDYLAKDFDSFRRALSDFSTQRYPQWVERSEADLGVMMMEALCAVADDLSYYQDRVAAEASLDTATQAVSVLRYARLVDYEPTPATVASVLLQLEVAEPVQLALAQPSQSGLLCSAAGPDGQAVPFEVGGGLADPVNTGGGGQLDPRWNRYRYVGGVRQLDAAGNPVFNLLPYWWDDSDRVLPATSTRLWLAGTGFGLFPGQQLVLDTDGPTSADPPVRELITVSGGADAPQETEDHLFGTAVTRVTFTPALSFDHDQAVSRLAGNLAPAVQGARVQETFAIPPVPAGTLAHPAPAPVVVRIGHDWQPDSAVPDYRYTLGGGSGPAPATAGPLSWLPGSSGTPILGDAVVPARPDLVLTTDNPDGTQVSWPWCRSLLDVAGPQQGSPAFTLTPERYSPVAVIDGMTCFDYDGGDGTTIRFGDGVFGEVPAPGTRFTVSYRIGLGSAGNVPADTVTAVAVGQAQASAVLGCTNPFPAAGGADAQTLQQVKDAAPEQFRAQPLCVVRPEDYVSAAQSLPWVAQAGSVFRWTGSWLSAYTTADPATSEQVSPGQVAELTALLNRQRLAGYASYVLSPRYLSVDLQVTVLAEPDQFRGNVEAAVLARLRPGQPPGGLVGFFDHSQWRFGMPLQWSMLAAAVQAVPGVAGVLSIDYRLRGVQAGFTAMPDTVTVAPDQILRADDDPSRPEAGSVTVIAEGGK
jgi:hypothetical protein